MSGTFLLTDVGRLVTCCPGLGEGPLGVIENGALTAKDGIITWVGRSGEVPEDDEPSDGGYLADGDAVIPGLIDCHTHLVFDGDRSQEFAARLRGEPYEAGGVRTTVEATRAADDNWLAFKASERLRRFQSFGVTTIEAKSGYGLTPGHERRLLEIAASQSGHWIDVIRTFMGAHVIPPEYETDPDGYVDLVCEGMIPSLGNLAEFADVWCDEGAFTVEQCRKILRAARAEGLSLKVHAEQLSHSGGAALAAEFGAISADHLEFATEEDADALARSKTIGVMLPGASMMTGGRFAPARMLIERGVRLALSTDFNPGTSNTENLILMLALACTELKMTPEEAILGVTRHAAAALGREGKIGSLEPGARCDFVAMDTKSELDLVYHYGVSPVMSVIKSGEIMSGPLVDGAAGGRSTTA